MSYRSLALLAVALLVGAASVARAVPAVPFDEETLDQIGVYNRAISEHYEELQQSSEELEVRRAIVKSRLDALEEELVAVERERPEVPRDDPVAQRVFDDHYIEAKSRYLEALAEKHAIDLEATRAFEVHGTGILVNLERLALALERSGRLDDATDDEGTREAFHSLAQGTAVALSVLEEWGALSREDPRFRALWATARVLSRNVGRGVSGRGIQLTVDLVRERTFIVRSLIDQARALRASLDQQGLLLQVAAQNQMLRLHFTRLGAINGLELPDLEIEDTTRRIIADIEEEPFAASGDYDLDPLPGFDACLQHGACY